MAKKTKSVAKKRDRLHMLIVELRFYAHIADMLLAGATRALEQSGATFERITVPGALEIPAAIAFAVGATGAKRAAYDGVVALGCVIEGETYHFEVVSNKSARGLMALALGERLAIGNGILTVDNEAQAVRRANPEDGDKGGAAARTALAMVKIKRDLAQR